MPPAWVADIFATFMLVVAAVSAARLVAARPWRRGAVVVDTDVSQLLTAIAMAGVLASGLAILGNTAWAVVFGVLTAWFAYRVVRDARVNGARALAGDQSAPHLAHGAAMLYMFLALTTMSGSSMAGMAPGTTMQGLRFPTLAFVFALILIGYTVWDLDQMHGFMRALAAAVTLPRQPALAGATGGTGNTETAAAAFSGSAAGGGAVANSSASPTGTERMPSNGVKESGRSRAADVALLPGITVGCRIALGVTMALMLFLMI
jgi:hypothetical protein